MKPTVSETRIFGVVSGWSARMVVSSVAFAVSDTGRGIPPDYLPRVFEPFVQVPDAPSGGSGLGLSISRRIVEAHRGQMTVRSEPGVGTTFTFTLPVAAGATSAGSGELCA